ncbi:hypothetical protein [Streptomyces chattanoogensis]|uniref:Uncharacterized protein n=1 Tax=Streptomyces chattanoogensis TaxID=66876 RepID=A0A0N0H1A2_9ACTN|nr:hypothetical protein [Streptomyces chattanoogensis]KPC64319.1 hypothetical protein ADL29_12420 [Streptomyces chattanoogensis]
MSDIEMRLAQERRFVERRIEALREAIEQGRAEPGDAGRLATAMYELKSMVLSPVTDEELLETVRWAHAADPSDPKPLEVLVGALCVARVGAGDSRWDAELDAATRELEARAPDAPVLDLVRRARSDLQSLLEENRPRRGERGA